MESVLFSFCYYALFVIVPIVVLALVSKDENFHSREGILYLLKYVFGRRAIQKAQKKVKVPKSFAEFERYENPRSITNENAEVISFSALDQNGNQLSVKLTLRADNIAEATICLRLGGNVYIFPDKGGVARGHISGCQWKCQGMNVEILEPFKRCRLTFNGFLRNTSPRSYGKTEYVSLRLIWNCCSKPNISLVDEDVNIIAKCLAKSTWRDGKWLNLLGNEKYFVQFGAFKGTVSGTNIPEVHLNMTCVRRRSRGTPETEALNKCVTLFAATENGLLMHLGVKALRQGCQELKFGFVLTHTGSVHPIRKCDLDLSKAERSISDKLTIHVEVPSKKMKVVLSMNNNSDVELINGNFEGYKVRNISAECSVNDKQGFAVLDHWTSHQGDGIKRPSHILREIKADTIPDTIVTPIGSDDSKIVELSGGKGNSLSLMKELENEHISIPDGFIVTTQAFKRQIESNFSLRKAVSLLEDIVLGKEDGDIKNACEVTVKFFEELSLSPTVEQKVIDELMKVRKEYDDKILPYLRWAVRSSAVGEDSEEFTSAGQNETFLGSQTDKDVLAKICKCWGSLFTYQSVMYRKQFGIPINTPMAVVVQKMIPADCSGVLFTCHPSNLDASKMMITSNFGLGETVVSGESEPDTIILTKSYEGEVALDSIALGSKVHSLVMGRYGIHKKTSDDNSAQQSLSESQALALGKVGVILEEAFGSPRDIEWAFFKDQLYILQSRPVTTLNQLTDEELTHEFDCPHISNDMYYTRANIGEVSPFAVTALTFSSIMNCIEKGFQIIMFGSWDPFVSRTLLFNHHFAMIELLAGFYARPCREIKIPNLMVDLAIFGRPVLNEEINKKAIDRYGLQSQSVYSKVMEMVQKYKTKRFAAGLVKDYLEEETRLDIGLADKDSVMEIYSKIDKSFEKVIKISYNHNIMSGMSIAYQHDVMKQLVKEQEIKAQHYSDLALILSSCVDVISADVPARLEEMAALIRTRMMVDSFLAVRPEEGVEWLRKNCREVFDLLKEFLDLHGHRLLGELEISLDTWDMDPSIIIKMLQMNCKFAPETKKSKVTSKNIMDELQTPMSERNKKKLQNAIEGYRRAVGYREQSKSAIIRTANKFRVAYRVLAKEMVKGGIIPTENLVYHLTHYEIWKLITKNNPALVAKALRRQRLYPSWNKLKFPEIMFGMPVPEDGFKTVEISDCNLICYGTPVSLGEVEARAVVLASLDDVDLLERGDILITKSTDIGWSPYFPILSGIITEIGGLVSHGAVVAREYGLPCIVGAKNATKLFKTGDRVRLSGNNGTVKLVSR